MYADIIKIKKIDLWKNNKIDKNKFIKDLDKRIKNYKNYEKDYSSSNLSQSGSSQILDYIKFNYFR